MAQAIHDLSRFPICSGIQRCPDPLVERDIEETPQGLTLVGIGGMQCSLRWILCREALPIPLALCGLQWVQRHQFPCPEIGHWHVGIASA